MVTRCKEKSAFSRNGWRLAAAAVGALCLIAAWRGSTLRAQGAVQTFEGTLNVVWGDPHPVFGAGGENRFALALPDGSILPLQLGGQAGTAALYFGKRVVVSGRAAAQNQFALINGQTAPLIVDTITLSQTLAQAEPFAASVFGTRRAIFLLVKFSDDAAIPHPPKFYTDMTDPDTPPAGEVFPTTLNAFFKKTSWNQFSWISDVGGLGGVGAAGGWLTLPHPKSYYAPCGFSSTCANLNGLGDDATALGRAQGINFKNYDNINFVLSNDLDCCAWGGSYFSSVDSKLYGATWEPPWGQETGTYSHEMGHSIGLPHSGWVYYSYDSPWDVMSARAQPVSVNCGSYLSANSGYASMSVFCPEPGDGYIAAHKDVLGWIPAANQVVVLPSSGSPIAVSLEADSLPLGAATKMIKVCLPGLPCTGATAHYITVEARVKGLGATSQFDNGISHDGVIIHDVQLNRPAISGPCFFNNQSGWAVPVDATPGDFNSANCTPEAPSNIALYNAQWNPGQTYVNTAYKLKIEVLSRAGSTFLVSVSSGSRHSRLSDFDGDGKVDITVFRPSNGTWFIIDSSTGTSVGVQWGNGLDLPVPGDYDGDGKTDVAVFRPSNGTWYIQNSSTGVATGVQWGNSLDIPVPGDYDGDGKTDVAVFRPSNGTWYIVNSSTGVATGVQWGNSQDITVPGDYDGDGKTDVAVFRPSSGTWYIVDSSTGTAVGVQWGNGLDKPVPGDYDGDGKTDVAIFRPSNGTWYIVNSSTGVATGVQWGNSLDTPVPGDYDGDGKTDIAVFRPSNGTWFIVDSSTGAAVGIQWGNGADIPILKR